MFQKFENNNEKLYSNYSNENNSSKFDPIKKINIWYNYEDTLNILASDDFENAFEWTQVTHDKVDTNRALIGYMFFGVETLPEVLVLDKTVNSVDFFNGR